MERCRPLNCIPGRSSVDIDSIEDNELSAANERISLLKKEESLVDSSNSTEHNHENDKLLNSVGDQLDVLAGNGGRSKLLSEENNRVRRETQRNPKHKFDRDDKRSKTIKQQSNLPDAALQREIIVEGLSSHEHDYQAKLLYTKSKFFSF